MEQVDYKEKYEQAMERARQFFEKPYLEDSAGIVGHIFPELKESEDERIRKEIRNFIFNYPEYLIERDSWLTWLEKQGKTSPIISNPSNIGKVEQKPTWSEEDQEIWEEISNLLWEGFKKTYTKFSWDEIKGWIKPKIESFKIRAQSQSYWKPTDEQMNALDDVISSRGIKYDVLSELWKDLEKLRNE